MNPRASATMTNDNRHSGDEQSTTSSNSNNAASLTPTEISFLNNLMKIPSGKKRLLKGLLKKKTPADNPLMPKANNKNKTYQQFKRDEEVVMNAMNHKLEQEQRSLERKRVKEEKRNREIIQKQMKEMRTSTTDSTNDDDDSDDGMPSFAAKYAQASSERKSSSLILRKECGCLRYPRCLCQSLSRLVDAPLDTTSSTASSSIMDASHNDMSIASVSLSGISLGTGMTSANMSAMFDNEVDSVDLNRIKLEAPASTVAVKRKKSHKRRSSSRLDASPTSVVVASDNASIMSGMDSSAMSITAL